MPTAVPPLLDGEVYEGDPAIARVNISEAGVGPDLSASQFDLDSDENLEVVVTVVQGGAGAPSVVEVRMPRFTSRGRKVVTWDLFEQGRYNRTIARGRFRVVGGID